LIKKCIIFFSSKLKHISTPSAIPFDVLVHLVPSSSSPEPSHDVSFW
jgi:hypothetical protein